MDVQYLLNIAIEAAKAAGEIIQQHMDIDVEVEEKTGGTSIASQVVTEVDRTCETVILSYLSPTCSAFDLALLSEERPDDGSRLKKDFFWCIDPLDGTLPFINKRTGFAVSIALVAKDGTPIIGVVYDPHSATLYHAIRGKGAFKQDQRWIIQYNNEHLTYVTDRPLSDTQHHIKIEQVLKEYTVAHHLNGIQHITGAGAVMNAILTLENGPACMLKLPKKESGGGCIWDYAATACIYHELGLPATNYAGERLDLNRKASTFMNHQGVLYSNFPQ